MTRTFSKRRTALTALVAAAAVATAAGAAIAQAQAPTAQAPPPRFRVELIVFVDLSFTPGQEVFERQEAPLAVPDLDVFDDDWLRAQQEAANLPLSSGQVGGAPSSPAVTQAPAGTQSSAVEPPFRLLSPEELELTPQYQRLAASRNWRPILHGGWVQDVVAESRTEPVRLTTMGVHNPAGTISLYRNNFLHLRLDVLYENDSGSSFSPAAQDAAGAGAGSAGAGASAGGAGAGAGGAGVGGAAFGGAFALQPFELTPRYRLEQSRQTRSGVMQHFDHPAFGVLVKVTEVPRASAPPGAPQRPEP